MFYTYNQNNSGGGFDFNSSRGLSHFVVIEADSASEADERALDVGIYFDEDFEIDCDCCGTRWGAADGYWGGINATVEPMVYGESAVGYDGGRGMKWMDGPEGYIHYKDGRIEGFWETA